MSEPLQHQVRKLLDGGGWMSASAVFNRVDGDHDKDDVNAALKCLVDAGDAQELMSKFGWEYAAPGFARPVDFQPALHSAVSSPVIPHARPINGGEHATKADLEIAKASLREYLDTHGPRSKVEIRSALKFTEIVCNTALDRLMQERLVGRQGNGYSEVFRIIPPVTEAHHNDAPAPPATGDESMRKVKMTVRVLKAIQMAPKDDAEIAAELGVEKSLVKYHTKKLEASNKVELVDGKWTELGSTADEPRAEPATREARAKVRTAKHAKAKPARKAEAPAPSGLQAVLCKAGYRVAPIVKDLELKNAVLDQLIEITEASLSHMLGAIRADLQPVA
jgi:hypothetical protein